MMLLQPQMVRAGHSLAGLPGGKRVRWSSFVETPNGLGARGNCLNLRAESEVKISLYRNLSKVVITRRDRRQAGRPRYPKEKSAAEMVDAEIIGEADLAGRGEFNPQINADFAD